MRLINIRLDTAREKIIVFADTTTETLQNKTQKEKRLKKINGASANYMTISTVYYTCNWSSRKRGEKWEQKNT